MGGNGEYYLGSPAYSGGREEKALIPPAPPVEEKKGAQPGGSLNSEGRGRLRVGKKSFRRGEGYDVDVPCREGNKE